MTLDQLKKLSPSEVQALQDALTPRMNKYMKHTPMPKQAAFMLCDAKEAFYGGAASGGKSDALLMDALQYMDVPGYSAIIFRKTYADLTKPGALIPRALEWLSPYMKTKEVHWSEKKKIFTFPGGATLQFGYMENATDRFNYDGAEFQYIGFDEVTHILEVCYKYMFSRLRKLKHMDVPTKMRSAANPPQTDDAKWVKTRFLDQGPENGRIFIPAGIDDNPHTDREDYEKSLEELDPVTRARLRDGNWEIDFQGELFKRDWFEWVDEVPMGAKIIRHWDMAATKKNAKLKKANEPDYTVGFKLAELSGIYYILDIARMQGRPHETDELQRNTARTDGYRVTQSEEREPGSSGIAVVENKARTIFKGYDYRDLPADTNKLLRAMAVSSVAERGLVKIVRGCRNVDDFLNEAESFPSGLHDDMVDGLSGAFAQLRSTFKTGAPIGVPNVKGSYWQDSQNPVNSYFRQI